MVFLLSFYIFSLSSIKFLLMKISIVFKKNRIKQFYDNFIKKKLMVVVLFNFTYFTFNVVVLILVLYKKKIIKNISII